MKDKNISVTTEHGTLSRKEFSSKLKELWDREGDIFESNKVIQAHPEHVTHTGRTGRQQVLRVLGEMRLLEGDVIIPEGIDSPAYAATPDRVMYCVYSTPVFNSNGYSTRSRGVAAGLKAAGADVVVVARSGYPWDWKIDTPMPKKTRLVCTLDDIEYVHLPNGGMDVLSPSAHIEQAADAFVQEALIQRPSYIQSASNYRVALPALIAARRLGIPFIYEVRGLWEITGASNKPGFEKTDRYFAMRDYESRVARAADHVFAITNQVKQELIARGVDESRISLAPNAVDPDRFFPIAPTTEMVASLRIDPNLPVIGFAGSIVKYEGLQTLLQASLLLHERGVKHQVVLAGSGNTEQSLKEFSRKNRMDWVKFLGRIPQDQVPQLLSVSNIIVTPRDSTVITELVSALKPLEAFAAGRAVVLSDVAPNVDLAGTDEQRAKVFPAGSANEMSLTLENLILNPSERVAIARTARQWIENERNWSRIGQNMFDQISSINRNRGASLPTKLELNDLVVGHLGGTQLGSLLGEYVSVVPLQTDDAFADEQKDLDYVLFELSKRSNTPGVNWNGVKLTIDPSLEAVLEQFQLMGVPVVGILNEGLIGASFEPKLLKLLDALLVGNYDGVIALLEDPQSANLRVGIIPPLLDEKSVEFNLCEVSNYVKVVDSSSDHNCSMDSLIQMLEPGSSFEPETKATEEPQEKPAENEIPAAIYIRSSVNESVARDLIATYGLLTPIFWEQSGVVSGWFGSVFKEKVQLIELISLLHQWENAPELREQLLKIQKSQLLASHTSQSWLALLSRSLGYPVRMPTLAPPENRVLNGHSIEEALVTLLQNEAQRIAPILLRGFNSQDRVGDWGSGDV